MNRKLEATSTNVWMVVLCTAGMVMWIGDVIAWSHLGRWGAVAMCAACAVMMAFYTWYHANKVIKSLKKLERVLGNLTLIQKLELEDTVCICGEALSHTIKNTIEEVGE